MSAGHDHGAGTANEKAHDSRRTDRDLSHEVSQDETKDGLE